MSFLRQGKHSFVPDSAARKCGAAVMQHGGISSPVWFRGQLERRRRGRPARLLAEAVRRREHHDADAKQPWGDEFGIVIGQFGISWLVNISQPQA